MDPIVTIGLVTYNRCDELVVAVNSVLNQTLLNWRLIISDDYSTDETESICLDFAKVDSRITYIKHTKIGMTANFNWVLSNTSTKYFMWLCDDDYLQENYLENNIVELENDLNLICSAGLTKSFNRHSSKNSIEIFFQLEMQSRIKRIVEYIKCVDKNIYLFGVFRHEVVKNTNIPDVYCSDLIWVAHISLLGKMKIISNTALFYSTAGISSSKDSLVDYFKLKKSNPYRIYRSELIKTVVLNEKLSLFAKFLIIINIYWIIHEKYLQHPIEKKLRGFLKIRTRFLSMFR